MCKSTDALAGDVHKGNKYYYSTNFTAVVTGHASKNEEIILLLPSNLIDCTVHAVILPDQFHSISSITPLSRPTADDDDVCDDAGEGDTTIREALAAAREAEYRS